VTASTAAIRGPRRLCLAIMCPLPLYSGRPADWLWLPHRSFPKAADGRGIQVVPARGDAVLFYSMLPDGNADDLALHAGMPITHGEKWVCNLWVWDPRRSR